MWRTLAICNNKTTQVCCAWNIDINTQRVVYVIHKLFQQKNNNNSKMFKFDSTEEMWSTNTYLRLIWKSVSAIKDVTVSSVFLHMALIQWVTYCLSVSQTTKTITFKIFLIPRPRDVWITRLVSVKKYILNGFI